MGDNFPKECGQCGAIITSGTICDECDKKNKKLEEDLKNGK